MPTYTLVETYIRLRTVNAKDRPDALGRHGPPAKLLQELAKKKIWLCNWHAHKQKG